ncbi:hypothetical protein BU25DRAFT_430790 [Macroventuria anomochaeta]|uniref:Uncharacterized protein n=1 Tax=Macroventuria anomochaeta TaxID=301207 RepID=A0ACB6S4A3_9PLEO|nr:uncharacterized protein BU25DRAFT_430790 [Macroventuria anomochaeta]KAF2628480.1 hypothetical protein BU25DRAFT_430790 [Macroventuria anomochaeta]
MYGVLFVGLVAATGGDISLSNFTPRIDNLPTKCKTVYDTKIDSCVSSDFNPGATCSSGCLAGLAKIGAAVTTGCAGVDVGETSIIGVFQNDLGTAALCPNNQQATTSSSSSSTARTTLRTSTRISTPVTTTAAPPTSTAASSSTSSSGLNLDTTATLATSTTTGESTGAVPTLVTEPSSAPNGNSQLSNSDSGGGSPFDVVATGAAPQLHITKAALSTFLAAVFFVACA